MTDWRDISSAPRTSKAILLWCPERQNIYEACWDHRYEGGWILFGGGNLLTQEPTHWMHLPAPPTQQTEE